MATEETDDAQCFNASQQSSLPDYPQMIMEAIDALKEKDGSNMASITKHIELTHSDLPENHSTLLSHHLNLMKQNGELVMSNNNYMKPDTNPPPKRGRGRPPKPKADLPSDAVVSPPRPRGRPPMPKDLLAPPKPKTPVSTGRPRGRPPKKAKTAATVTAPPPPPGVKRGRGRPPKVSPSAGSQ